MSTLPTEIDSLELQISSDSSNAVSGIERLSSSLSTLRNSVKGGIGLTSVANQISKLNAALSSVDGSSADKISRLADSLSKLSSLGSIKISSSIGNQIKNIASATSSLSETNFTSIEKLSKSVSSLSGIRKPRGLISVVNQLKKLPELEKTLNDMNLDNLCNYITKLSNTLTPLAERLNTVSSSISKLPASVRRLSRVSEVAAGSNNNLGMSAINLWAKFRMAYNVIQGGAQTVGSWITKSNEYIEDVNLFTASLGEYASEAQKYAEQVGDIMGIDPGEFMRYEGVFNTIINGFGVASDKAYIMSKNLTQLGYDLSSFYNISFEDSMRKLQSGISGELEPLRRLGYDLSVARLQQEALNLGIEKHVSDMNQAEKSQLRYYAIMTQVTVAQGDMARTLNAPANQIRILQAQVAQCARALGEIFIPALNAVLPYAIALAKIIRMLATEIANLFGFKMPKVDYSGISRNLGSASNSVGNIANDSTKAGKGLGTAAKKAKELKKTLLGIDELHTLASSSVTSGGSGSGKSGSGAGGGGNDLGIDLPQYDFLSKAIDSRVNKIFKKMKKHLKEVLSIVSAIGAAFAAWKVAKGVISLFDTIKDLGGTKLTGIVGLTMFLSDMNRFSQYMKDFLKNGPTFQNVAGMITEFAGMIGDAFVMMGHVKLGGAMKVVQGIGEIVIAIKGIGDGNVNWTNVSTAIRGVSNVIIGIGLIRGDAKGLEMTGVGLVLQGLLDVIPQLKNVIKAIKSGDWSVVDWSSLVIGAIETIGGIAAALAGFKGAVIASQMTKTGKDMKDVATATSVASSATEEINTNMSGTGGFSPRLVSLAKNMLLGIAIIGEAAGATLIIVGSIALLGKELGSVKKSWSPVIDNGKEVARDTAIGASIIAAVGLATYGLGSQGKYMAIQMGIGTLVLGEVSLATDLFIAEVVAIGKLLTKVYDSWKPVLKNGKSIASAIALGTSLLVGIGLVTAGLGAASVGSYGLLPAAIGIGSALLLGLTAALKVLVDNMAKVAKSLNEKLAPELNELNGNLPGLTSNMKRFKSFMSSFAGTVASFSGDTILSGLASGASSVISFFTGNPISNVTKQVSKIARDAKPLSDKLDEAVSKLKECKNKLSDVKSLMKKIAEMTDSKATTGIMSLKSNVTITVKVKLEKSGWKTVKGWIGSVPTISQAVKLTKSGWTTLRSWIGAVTTINQPVRLTRSGWSSVRGWIGTISTIYQTIALRRSGWSSVRGWIGSVPTIYQYIGLRRSGWYSIRSWIGTVSTIYQYIGLRKSGWWTVNGWIGNIPVVHQYVGLKKYGWWTVNSWVNSYNSGSVTVTVYLRKGWRGSARSWIGLSTGGSIDASGYVHRFADGGRIGLNRIEHYASGTSKTHGSLFVAGESGAEVVGHLNGHTEVLNKSQMAEVMQSAVVAGMSPFASYWKTMDDLLVRCTNALISANIEGINATDNVASAVENVAVPNGASRVNDTTDDSAIQTAMYNAMMMALRSDEAQNKNISLYLDGNVIYKDVVRRNNAHVIQTGESEFNV